MQLQNILFGGLLEIFILHTIKADIPGCHFYETVNISSSQRLPNGSYVYQGLEVPEPLTGEYNYIRSELGYNKTVKSHLRGCVCQLKPCIWICCRFQDMGPNEECNDGLMKELARIKPFLNVTLSNGSVAENNLLSDFIVNGSVLLQSDENKTIKLRGYDCLHPNQFSSGNTEFLVAAFHGVANEWNLPGRPQLIWLSEICLILTIAVYLYVKELRNLHGKCFICYLFCTFMFLVHEYLALLDIPLQFCTLNGCSYYFFWMAKLNWLLSLSHQMWIGLTLINGTEYQHSFRTYSIFAWGLAAILTGVLFLIDLIFGDDSKLVDWIPGIGWGDCDSKQGWSFKVYINGPFAVLVVVNTIFFILTSISIVRTKLRLNDFIDDERTMHHSSRMQTYMMFLRLTIIMDLQWSIRLIGLILFFNFNTKDTVLKICHYCDYCIGIIIFVFFILKRSTIRLLIDHLVIHDCLNIFIPKKHHK
ncbi:G-protein coupled receptor Mth-like [Drosophila serrata]|uniref:G-protein coupled receptor Mth-like n=1 Tax=Drosophila serrata TaxID=7274 RepID=UPI000A1D00F2|nr:G-protein coupled receptor Mth-like [Drosophila serrata]